MATSTATRIAPSTFEDAAAALADAARAGQQVRFRGGGTKLAWGHPPAADVELSTAGLDQLREHNAGDLTAVLEAGVPLAIAQAKFAAAGQMLALDPPLGEERRATIGGIVATGDCGPLRHRYGAPRDLVIGATVALSDGAIARSGGKVIKNVAGYDLAKLFAGSFGTLGLILAVSVRLHPRAAVHSTALGAATDPERLAAAALSLAAEPYEFEALDVAWRAGRGGILMRCGGREHARRAARAAQRLQELGLAAIEVTDDDEALWQRQRDGQRSHEALLRVTAPRTALADVLRATDTCEGTLVGRAALGTNYVEVSAARAPELRRALPAAALSLVLDWPADADPEPEPWGKLEPSLLSLTRSVKERFDPTATCNRGLFVDRI